MKKFDSNKVKSNIQLKISNHKQISNLKPQQIIISFSINNTSTLVSTTLRSKFEDKTDAKEIFTERQKTKKTFIVDG